MPPDRPWASSGSAVSGLLTHSVVDVRGGWPRVVLRSVGPSLLLVGAIRNVFDEVTDGASHFRFGDALGVTQGEMDSSIFFVCPANELAICALARHSLDPFDDDVIDIGEFENELTSLRHHVFDRRSYRKCTNLQLDEPFLRYDQHAPFNVGGWTLLFILQDFIIAIVWLLLCANFDYKA